MAGYRPIYTLDEDTLILEMIIKTDSYYKLRGRSFWEDLSNCGLIDRTWNSLKEHFDKHILQRINDKRYEIPNVEKKKIALADYQQRNLKHFDDEHEIDSIDSDDDD